MDNKEENKEVVATVGEGDEKAKENKPEKKEKKSKERAKEDFTMEELQTCKNILVKVYDAKGQVTQESKKVLVIVQLIYCNELYTSYSKLKNSLFLTMTAQKTDPIHGPELNWNKTFRFENSKPKMIPHFLVKIYTHGALMNDKIGYVLFSYGQKKSRQLLLHP
eukprot:TRINITY_DN4383_c0_g1_i6.p1 TRINITY_DN4383_c0_g1~~TRINITY_DN4383_c0_g1_i6.p1  ORF type:complete len:164 (-),score=48.58 TRINITY_DN4383_c0_g1_i6:255-746(-)